MKNFSVFHKNDKEKNLLILLKEIIYQILYLFVIFNTINC